MIFDFIRLDKNSNVALWRQIYRQFAQATEDGKITPRTQLPSIRELSEGLSISRSPVENAYVRLLLDGYIASRPKSGYFIVERRGSDRIKTAESRRKDPNIKYDLGSGKVEADITDITAWRKSLRAVLKHSDKITSRGDPCGEPELREQLASYTYRARGVRCKAENIIAASGTQQLLSLLLRSFGRAGLAVLESPGYERGERVLRDYGWQISIIKESNDTAKHLSDADIFMDIASKRPLTYLAKRMRRRSELALWAREGGRIIIEDDYNGELRYLARPIPAIQPLAPEDVVYIGSFSQLLLPSVRIAYMVLPSRLAERCLATARFYDPTSSKIEQLALAAYIHNGELERRLKRCRKIYLRKYHAFANALGLIFDKRLNWQLLETSTTFFISSERAEELRVAALREGINVDVEDRCVLLSFAAIAEEDIEDAVRSLANAWQPLLKK